MGGVAKTKIGTGNNIPAKDIKSTAGGSYPHMPPATSYSGRMNDGIGKGASTAKSTKTKMPHLPDDPNGT